jgi:hypothetical protein
MTTTQTELQKAAELFERKALEINGTSFANDYQSKQAVKNLIRSIQVLSPKEFEFLKGQLCPLTN